MCDSFITFLHVLTKTGTVRKQTLTLDRTIPTTTAGGLWGAYLMTVAHFYKELAS